MITRILRFLLVTSVLATALIFIKPISLLKTDAPSVTDYAVSAKDLQVSCLGSAILAGGSTGTSVTGFKRIANTQVSASYSGASSTTLIPSSGKAVQGFSVRQDLSLSLRKQGSLKVVDPTGKTAQGSTLLTANQVQLVNHKRIRGLVAAPCLRPQSEFWLVGGSTKVGRETLLVMTNPSLVDATVDLEVFTENGISHSAGLTGIAVPKGQTTVLPLAGFVLRAQSIVVHVASHGGSITALLQQKTMRGISANGADYVAPATTLAKRSFFPGILVRGSQDSSRYRSSASKYKDVQNMLRVFVPGNVDAKLTLQVLGTGLESFGTVISVDAPAGKVSDFEIKGLQDGDYFATLSSNVDVYSAIRLVRSRFTSDKFADFTWVNAAEPFTTSRYIAIPKIGISKLSLVNPSDQPTTIALKVGSATVKTTIPANSQRVVPAAAGLSMGIVPGNQAIYAHLIIDVNGRVAGLPVLDEKNISGNVQVSVH